MRRKQKVRSHSSANRIGPDRSLGENLSFAASEAYKLLRTNLFFCLPAYGEATCRVVGVTSSVQGEGKSTTSINLSYMLAQDGKKVCLIEGDMRAPTFKSRLKLKSKTGLSHVLAGMKTNPEEIRCSALHPNMKVISAGEMPPNPTELLGSERMTKLLELLRGMYDFIIIDLPPVTVVADALTVGNLVDGMLVVVENGVTTKRELDDAMHRMEVIRDKILGFIVTHAEGAKGKYGKKKYGYGYGYGERKPSHVTDTSPEEKTSKDQENL